MWTGQKWVLEKVEYFNRSSTLTHWGRVTHIWVSKLNIIDSSVAWSEPSHYLNQCWIIVNWTLGNKLQWNLNRNSSIFIQENAFECVVCETAAILSWPQCVYDVTFILFEKLFKRNKQSTSMPHTQLAKGKHCRLKLKANYNFTGFALMLINVPICLRNLSQNPIRSRNALVKRWSIATEL